MYIIYIYTDNRDNWIDIDVDHICLQIFVLSTSIQRCFTIWKYVFENLFICGLDGGSAHVWGKNN